MKKEDQRCFGSGKPFYEEYHDKEWGIPVHDDIHLFEMLSLEGAQAGLSWETILIRRGNYKALFHNFDPKRVAKMSDQELEGLTKNPSIIRNRLKIFSIRKNALVFLKIQEEFGSFDTYLWNFVDNTPIINHFKNFSEVPASTPLSEKISKDLKKRGMTFVGPTIIYAFLQAVGVINDHLTTCPNSAATLPTG